MQKNIYDHKQKSDLLSHALFYEYIFFLDWTVLQNYKHYNLIMPLTSTLLSINIGLDSMLQKHGTQSKI